MAEFDAFSGDSFEDIARRHSSLHYVVQATDRNTIRNIEELLRNKKYKDRDEALEHIKCLESVEKRLQNALDAETEAHIVDDDLRKAILHVQRVLATLRDVRQSLPRTKVYS